jgi:hypothetical protein
VWHLPNDADTRTSRQLDDTVHRHAGHPAGRLRAIPPLLPRVLGLANPTLRELVEMQYQFDEPFIVDGSKITNVCVEIDPGVGQMRPQGVHGARAGDRGDPGEGRGGSWGRGRHWGSAH